MAKSQDEEPRSEAPDSASAPVDTTTQSAAACPRASSSASRSSASDEHARTAVTCEVHAGEPQAKAPASSASSANPMADPPSSNKHAFCAIFTEHRAYLLVLAWRLSGDSDAAEDFVQETFTRALTRFDGLRPGSHIRAWLSRILTNLFLDKNKHKKVVEKAAPMLSAEHSVADDPQIAHEALSAAQIEHDALRDAIEQLELDDRVMIDCSVAGKSYKEIADELGLPMGTVSSRMKRARDRLKELLTQTRVPKK